MSKTFVGVVSSDKTDKTIVVSVQSQKTHPLYKKQYNITKRFLVHDEKNEAKLGDKVMIVETKPLSARKRHLLEKILERPAIAEEQSVEAVTTEPEPEPKEPKAKSRELKAKDSKLLAKATKGSDK